MASRWQARDRPRPLHRLGHALPCEAPFAMALTLYGGARTRASMHRWYLEEKGIGYDWRHIDMDAG